jgi:hypothetical protein
MICAMKEGRGTDGGSWFDTNIRRVVGDERQTFFWTDNWLDGVPLNIRFSCLYELSVHKDCLVEEMARLGWMVGGNGWVWRRLLMAWEEDSVRECASLLNNVILQENIHDQWRWLLGSIHGYSVSETYRFLTDTYDQVAVGILNDVWHKLIPTKVSLFVWRLLQDRIPTKSNLVRRHVLQPIDNLCVVRSVWISMSVDWCSLCFSRLGNGSFLSVYSLVGFTIFFPFLSKGYLASMYLGNLEGAKQLCI